MNSLEIPQLQNIEETIVKIKSGELSVLELVTEHLKRAHEVQDKTNAFITILDEQAINSAKKLDDELANQPTSEPASAEAMADRLANKKLLGIPFTVKDLYLVDGTKT